MATREHDQLCEATRRRAMIRPVPLSISDDVGRRRVGGVDGMAPAQTAANRVARPLGIPQCNITRFPIGLRFSLFSFCTVRRVCYFAYHKYT